MVRAYLITRFNLALYKRNKYLQSVRNADWLAERFELFEQFCLPSVVRQTRQDFLWFVLFDTETPAAYVERVEAYRKLCPMLRPIWVAPSEAWHFLRKVRGAIAQDLAEQQAEGIQIDKVLTSCLDNDDALAAFFMERAIERAEQVAPRTYISFRSGIQYFTELGMATHLKYPNNHFLSLVECPNEQGLVRTVFAQGDHSRLYDFKGVQIYLDEGEEPAWLEVVHGSNIANDVYMHSRTPMVRETNALRQHFGSSVLLRPNARSIYYTRYLLRCGREVVRKGFFKILRHIPFRILNNRHQG